MHPAASYQSENGHSLRRSGAALLALTAVLAVGLAGFRLGPASADSPAAASAALFAVERVSVAGAGQQADNLSFDPAITADGRYVVFISEAANLAAGDTNGVADVFVHDRWQGVTRRVSVAADGQELDAPSGRLALAAAGRYVAFVSQASALVPAGMVGLVRADWETGESRLLHSYAAALDPWSNTTLSLSGDGQWAALMSYALAEASADNPEIYLYDAVNDGFSLASLAPDGQPANFFSEAPALSDDGRYVAYQSFADNLVPDDANGYADVFVYDRLSGATERVSVTNDGQEGDNDSNAPDLSADGRWVAFTSGADNLKPDEAMGSPAIYVRDRQLGQTEPISVDSSGQPAHDWSDSPAISADGRYVAFVSAADNLVPDDTNGVPDIFVRDRQAGLTHRVSVAADGSQANAGSYAPDLSGDGRYVVFASDAGNLVPGDTNGQPDIFVFDLRQLEQAATPTPAPVIGTGTGLRADYFDAPDLSGAPAASQLDPQVDFAWGEAALVPSVSADNVSVRWTGEVQPRFTQSYVFSLLSDDGVRLWIDGQLVIDDWQVHSPAWNSSQPIPLAAGAHYALTLEYFEEAGNAEAHLYWESASEGLALIPSAYLYPAALPSATETATPTHTAPPTATRTPTVPTATRTRTPSPTVPTATPTWTRTSAPTPTRTASSTSTRTATVAPTATRTRTPSPTVPTATPTWTQTSTPASTSTATPTPTWTRTPAPTPTRTVTAAPTVTETPATPTDPATPDGTGTGTGTWTPTATHTATAAPPTLTSTPSPTATGTAVPASPTPTLTAIPTATATSSATPTTAPPADFIFADGFESGDLSAWASRDQASPALSVRAAAALVGGLGLRVDLDEAPPRRVVDTSPAAETRYRARFYFDPHGLTLAPGDEHVIFDGVQQGGQVALRIELRRAGGHYQVRAGLSGDDGAWANTAWFGLSDAPHALELEWHAAVDGGLTLWIDGLARAALAGVDNSARRVDRARLGAVSGVDAGTHGRYFFDAFESRRFTYIGP